MQSKELIVRLAIAAENAEDAELNDLAELLNEAEGELEFAMDIIETVNTPEANRFMARHTVDMHAEMLQNLRKMMAEDVLKAATFMAGRDRAKAGDVLDALGLNRTRSAYQHADLVMGKGKYARRNGEYRRTV
jgi:hypothetical protein